MPLILIVLAASCGRDTVVAVSGKLEDANGVAIDLASPDLVKVAGRCELRVYYIAKGSRSEGVHGVLINQGKVIDALPGQETLETDLGTLVYHGPFEQRELPFAKSGWLPKELWKVYPSWQVAKQDR